MPGSTVYRVLRCVNCIMPDRMLDSIYCAKARYWILENLNDVISHCALLEIPEREKNYLMCENDECECRTCTQECVGKKNE